MTFDELVELHYITPIDNVPSILQHGILCYLHARSVSARSIADPRIQERRAKKTIPTTGNRLHTYAPLYFNPRNAMMFKRKHLHDQLCVLRVSKRVMHIDGVIIADRNAASDHVRFAEAPEGLSLIGPDVFLEDWRHNDRIEYLRRRSRVCAEVLVPWRVPPAYLIGAYVSGEAGRRALTALQPPWEVVVNPRIFFLE